MTIRPLSALTDVQTQDPLRGELIGRPTVQEPAVAMGEHPFVEVGIIHNIDVLTLMEPPHVMVPVVHRDPATLIDPPQRHDPRQVLGHPRPLPHRRLRSPIVTPAGMRQVREDREATPTSSVGVVLAVQAVHLLQAGLQLRGRSAGPRLAPPRRGPLGPLDDPVLLRSPRVVPVHPGAQADQPERQLGGEVAPGPPGPAVVDAEATGQPPADEGQSELLADGLGGDSAPGPEGGRPRSRGPRRCIRRSGGASSPHHYYTIEYVLLHPSARSHAERSPGSGRPAAAGPPGPGTARRGRTIVAASAPRRRAAPVPPGAAARGSGRLPRWDGHGAASRRPGRPRGVRPRWPRGRGNPEGCRRGRGGETAGGTGARWGW